MTTQRRRRDRTQSHRPCPHPDARSLVPHAIPTSFTHTPPFGRTDDTLRCFFFNPDACTTRQCLPVAKTVWGYPQDGCCRSECRVRLIGPLIRFFYAGSAIFCLCPVHPLIGYTPSDIYSFYFYSRSRSSLYRQTKNQLDFRIRSMARQC